MRKDTPQSRQIKEINYNKIKRHFSCYSCIPLILPRVENTIDPAITDVNFPRPAYIHVQMQLTKDDLYAQLCCGQSTDVFPISCSAATKMLAQT